jgi:hypothetical protein
MRINVTRNNVRDVGHMGWQLCSEHRAFRFGVCLTFSEYTWFKHIAILEQKNKHQPTTTATTTLSSWRVVILTRLYISPYVAHERMHHHLNGPDIHFIGC